MANVRICDRCGKKLEFGKKFCIGTVVYAHRLMIDLIDNGEKDYDLCPNCKNDFDIFMEGPSSGSTAESAVNPFPEGSNAC